MTSDANARAQAAAAEWEAKAIEACENNPRIKELGLCPTCMCHYPCLCDDDRTKAEMVRYFEKYKDNHPMTAGNWGSTVDLFWYHLHGIANTRYEQVFCKSERTTQRYFDDAEACLQKAGSAASFKNFGEPVFVPPFGEPVFVPPTIPKLPDPSEWTGRQPRKPGWLLKALRPFWPWR